MVKNTKPLEYQMAKKMFNAILDKRNDLEKKQNPYNYVIDVINKEFGLRGEVKKIFIYED